MSAFPTSANSFASALNAQRYRRSLLNSEQADDERDVRTQQLRNTGFAPARLLDLYRTMGDIGAATAAYRQEIQTDFNKMRDANDMVGTIRRGIDSRQAEIARNAALPPSSTERARVMPELDAVAGGGDQRLGALDRYNRMSPGANPNVLAQIESSRRQYGSVPGAPDSSFAQAELARLQNSLSRLEAPQGPNTAFGAPLNTATTTVSTADPRPQSSWDLFKQNMREFYKGVSPTPVEDVTGGIDDVANAITPWAPKQEGPTAATVIRDSFSPSQGGLLGIPKNTLAGLTELPGAVASGTGSVLFGQDSPWQRSPSQGPAAPSAVPSTVAQPAAITQPAATVQPEGFTSTPPNPRMTDAQWEKYGNRSAITTPMNPATLNGGTALNKQALQAAEARLAQGNRARIRGRTLGEQADVDTQQQNLQTAAMAKNKSTDPSLEEWRRSQTARNYDSMGMNAAKVRQIDAKIQQMRTAMPPEKLALFDGYIKVALEALKPQVLPESDPVKAKANTDAVKWFTQQFGEQGLMDVKKAIAADQQQTPNSPETVPQPQLQRVRLQNGDIGMYNPVTGEFTPE